MKPFFGFINNFLVIVSGFIVVTCIMAYAAYDTIESNQLECLEPAPQLFCGTVSPELSELATKGKKLYNANCAACHKLDKRSAGPALRGVVDTKFPSENFFAKFVTNKNQLQGDDRLYAEKFSEHNYSEFQHKFKLTESEVDEIKTYLK